MIVSMKKVTVVVQSKDIDPTLKALGKAGVLHIEHQKAPVGESITELEEKYRSLSKAIEALPDARNWKGRFYNPEELIYQILNLVNEKETFVENLKKIKKDIDIWKEWGDFIPGIINNLKNKNIWIRLCKITKERLQNVPEGVILKQLFKKGNILYCVTISTKEIALPFEVLSLPEQSLSEMLVSREREENRIRQIDKRLIEFAESKNALFSYREQLKSHIEFSKVRTGMGRFEKLSYLRGYCPVYNVNSLEKLSEQEKWGLIIEDPDEGDRVPTLIKNPRWIEIIKPVFQMINTIPGYREVDISLWFLLFFSVFFGILIGDAGYGLIFFVANLLLHIKFKNLVKIKPVFFLMYVLSSCAIIWGILSGTFFGQAHLSERVKPLLPYLREDVNIQAICFFIGALHLSIAHTWRFIRKLPSLKALSEAGWISILWAAYFLAKSLILNQPFPIFGKWLFVIGAILIILFTNPAKNIFRSISSGIGNFLLHIINSFTDVVSYIRLFAVGAATVAVADAFNYMAFSIGHGNFFMGFLTALILLFGHTLNILLGAMAILVHGVRLNVLEFSSHLNMEWSGVEYAPFQMKPTRH